MNVVSKNNELEHFQSILGFRFHLVEELGRGGMGIVYKARRRGDETWVVIKTLLSESQEKGQARQRFVLEAQALLRVQHPHIVKILEFKDDGPWPYIVMEWIEGCDLAERVRGGIDEAWVLQIFSDLADALARCHAAGVIHRDLKPANILVRRSDDKAILVDFGLVKDLGLEHTRVDLTKTGMGLGTPSFMAPEQFDRSVWGDMGPRTDVWGLGGTIYSALTGRAPNEGSHALEIIKNLVRSGPPRVSELRPEVSPWLDQLCADCLERKPEQRPSLDELSERLREAAPAARSGFVVMITLALGLLIFGLLAALLSLWEPASTKSTKPKKDNKQASQPKAPPEPEPAPKPKPESKPEPKPEPKVKERFVEPRPGELCPLDFEDPSVERLILGDGRYRLTNISRGVELVAKPGTKPELTLKAPLELSCAAEQRILFKGLRLHVSDAHHKKGMFEIRAGQVFFEDCDLNIRGLGLRTYGTAHCGLSDCRIKLIGPSAFHLLGGELSVKRCRFRDNRSRKGWSLLVGLGGRATLESIDVDTGSPLFVMRKDFEMQVRSSQLKGQQGISLYNDTRLQLQDTQVSVEKGWAVRCQHKSQLKTKDLILKAKMRLVMSHMRSFVEIVGGRLEASQKCQERFDRGVLARGNSHMVLRDVTIIRQDAVPLMGRNQALIEGFNLSLKYRNQANKSLLRCFNTSRVKLTGGSYDFDKGCKLQADNESTLTLRGFDRARSNIGCGPKAKVIWQ